MFVKVVLDVDVDHDVVVPELEFWTEASSIISAPRHSIVILRIPSTIAVGPGLGAHVSEPISNSVFATWMSSSTRIFRLKSSVLISSLIFGTLMSSPPMLIVNSSLIMR